MAKAVVVWEPTPCRACGRTIARKDFGAYPPGADPGLHHLTCVPRYPGIGGWFVASHPGRCAVCPRAIKPRELSAFLKGEGKRTICAVCMVTPPDAPTPVSAAPSALRKPIGRPVGVGPSDRLTAAPVAASLAAEIHSHFDRSQLAGGVLLHHQLGGAAWLLDHPRALLADEVGLGKTITVFGVISALVDRGVTSSARPVMWVTEAALVGQTAAELAKFLPGLSVVTGTDPGLKSDSSAKARRLLAERTTAGVHVYVLSYDFLHKRPTVASGLLRQSRTPLLVLDEVTAVKQGPEGVTWRAVSEMASKADRVIGMTATPIENDPMEPHSILDAIDTPGLWERQAYEREYVEWREGYRPRWGGWVAPKPKGFLPGQAAAFTRYLKTVAIRRTAAGTGIRKPRLVGQAIHWVALTPQQEREYERVAGWSGLRGYQARERLARESKGGYSSLLKACIATLKTRDPAEKIVIYTETLGLGDRLCEQLDYEQIGYVRIQGATSKEDRADAIARHRDDAEVRVLVGSRVLEYGLNLQYSRVLFSIDASWNPARERQREGRICRIGSPHETYEHLTFAPRTKQAMRKANELSRKGRLAAEVLDALAGEGR